MQLVEVFRCPGCTKDARDDSLDTLRQLQKVPKDQLPFCNQCLRNGKEFRLEKIKIPYYPPGERPPAEVVVIRVGPNKELEIEWFTREFTHQLDLPRPGWRQYTQSLPLN